MQSIQSGISALVALQNVKKTDFDLSQVQQKIFKDKDEFNARRDPVIWALSSTLNSDVRSYRVISDSLHNGARTVAVARSAAEKVVDALEVIKQVAEEAATKKVNRAELQETVDRKREEIRNIINGGGEAGVSLLRGGQPLEILASLDKAPVGNAPAFLRVGRLDFTENEDTVAGDALTGPGQVSVNRRITDAGGTGVVTFAAGRVATASEAGRSTGYTLKVNRIDVHYTLREGENQNDAVEELVKKFNIQNKRNLKAEAHKVDDPLTETAHISIVNDTAKRLWLGATSGDASAAGGILEGIDRIDLSRRRFAREAVRNIDHLIELAGGAVTEFRGAEQRIERQGTLIADIQGIAQKNIDGLIETSLQESAARLKALQVQQFISGQRTAIGNDQPAYLLSLFE